jgi:metal-sulfur cluster biosynthetic enzyme
VVAHPAARGGRGVNPRQEMVMQLLDTIQDPCSVRMGKPLGLVGMGLIESVAIDDDAIRVRMVLTGPGCFFFFQFADSIAKVLEPIAAGREVDVTIDDTILWSKDRMHVIPIRTAAERRPEDQ